MDIRRIFRHLAMPPWRLRQIFPPASLAAIENAVAASEATHGGEIRFAVEATLATAALLHGQSARARAIELFSRLRIWDTERNNGVLIYLLLADRDVEIVADRGINDRVGSEEWEKISRRMEAAFREGKYEEGVLAGIEAVTRQIGRHYPHRGERPDELPDRPVLL